MADVLDEDMPELSKEDPKKKQEDDFEGNEEEIEVSVEPGTGASSLWEDDDVKNFYENLGLFLNWRLESDRLIIFTWNILQSNIFIESAAVMKKNPVWYIYNFT